MLLHIHKLSAKIGNRFLLQDLSLEIPEGEVHAMMGPNGAGKSTLAKVLAGHPAYEITGGEVWFKGQNILEMEPEERAHLGIFLSFQYPVEITGIENHVFLKEALQAQKKARNEPLLNDTEFTTLLEASLETMQIRSEFTTRSLNEGFSGGEKKRNEILQMMLFQPDLAILDETDSGLDIDALRVVAEGVNRQRNPRKSMLIITHYQRLLEYIRPDRVHILADGKIIRSGDAQLALDLEKQGYEWITR